MQSGRVHVAVVGYGYWGSKHVRVLSAMPDVTVSLWTPTPNGCGRRRSPPSLGMIVSDLEAALDRVDAVLVATSPADHAGIGLQALNAGKHVLIEKPLATTVADAEELVAAAAASDVQLMVGHTFEYNPAVRRLREIIRAGELGRVLSIDTARLSLGLYRRDVNVIWDLAPHDISITSYLLDEHAGLGVGVGRSATSVRGQRGRRVPAAGIPDRRHAFVHVSWLNPNKVRRTTVVGERRMAVFDDMSDNERIRIYDIGVDPRTRSTARTWRTDMPVSYRTGDITSPFVQFREPLSVAGPGVHRLPSARGRAQLTPGERGLDIVRVLAATDVSLATGQVCARASPACTSSARTRGALVTAHAPEIPFLDLAGLHDRAA